LRTVYPVFQFDSEPVNQLLTYLMAHFCFINSGSVKASKGGYHGYRRQES
jgi:hypothetical protein